MEFGVSPEVLRYSVVICPKCREHVQIIEAGKKTVSCQKCGARMQARKLRVFYSSDELEKAVAARTKLQAEITGKGKKDLEEDIFHESGIHRFVDGKGTENKFPQKATGKSQKGMKREKSSRKIIIGSLEAAGGEMEIVKLREKALEKDLGEEKFEEALKKLLERGEVYSPTRDRVKIV